MSALYSRYPAKDDLLGRLCHDGLRAFIDAAEAPSQGDAWEDLAVFLRRVIAADVHALTIHLAGTFAPTPEMHAEAQRANALASQLLDGARKSGQVRPGISLGDLQLALEACSSIRLPDEERAAVMRQRLPAMLLEGWRPPAKGATPHDLPGPAPTPEEINRRWQAARR
jgi:AcrR family transcriptional regulator